MSYKRTSDEVMCEDYSFRKLARFDGTTSSVPYAFPIYQQETYTYADSLMDTAPCASAVEMDYCSPPEAMMGEASPASVAMEVETNYAPHHRFITSFVTY
eukprot:comp27632_c0_seq1/m.47167 comp27632_c0_seq1/g.47167  ORF comp27632_c0_seq1/g.47167 comp27632_c0_seq1/m.47167 type:complete len:100 (-) comp27632_c0_seq1:364-663(-)